VSVITYDCPSGPREMLGSGRRGWVTAESPDGLAHALAERLSPEGCDDARRRAAAAQEYLVDFAPAGVLPRWRAYLDGLADDRGGARAQNA
jgi:glycosyltransferase involved in cell wall biosynthesis